MSKFDIVHHHKEGKDRLETHDTYEAAEKSVEKLLAEMSEDKTTKKYPMLQIVPVDDAE